MKMNRVMKRWEEAERCLNGPLEDKSPTGEKVKEPSCLTEQTAPQSDPKSDYTHLNSDLNRSKDQTRVYPLPPKDEETWLLFVRSFFVIIKTFHYAIIVLYFCISYIPIVKRHLVLHRQPHHPGNLEAGVTLSKHGSVQWIPLGFAENLSQAVTEP